MVAADPDLLRVRPVDVTTFWDDLEEALEFNPVVGADDAPTAEPVGAPQPRVLLALPAIADIDAHLVVLGGVMQIGIGFERSVINQCFPGGVGLPQREQRAGLVGRSNHQV